MKSYSRTCRTCLILPETWQSTAMSSKTRTYSLLSFPCSLSSRRTSHFSMWVSAGGHCLFWWLTQNGHYVTSCSSSVNIRKWLKSRRTGQLWEAEDDCKRNPSCWPNGVSQHGPCPYFEDSVCELLAMACSGKKVKVSLPLVRKSWIVI